MDGAFGRCGGPLFLAAALILLHGCASGSSGTSAVKPASAADAQAADRPGPAERDPYIIGPEDVLSIVVWREEGLGRQVRVRPDGYVSFPLVGDVDAAGLTAPQLEAELSKRLEAFVTAPAVSVIVDEVNSYKVYVLGEVGRPGPLATRVPVTVLQALSLAGGLKPFADGDRMVLVRQMGSKSYRVRLNYGDLVLGRNGAIDLALEPGDVLVVP